MSSWALSLQQLGVAWADVPVIGFDLKKSFEVRVLLGVLGRVKYPAAAHLALKDFLGKSKSP